MGDKRGQHNKFSLREILNKRNCFPIIPDKTGQPQCGCVPLYTDFLANQ